MYLTYGTVALNVIDLQRYERTNVYTPDGADLLYVKHVLGVTAVYVPGGVPSLVSVTKLSNDTGEVLAGNDPTAELLGRNPRGLAPGTAVSPRNPTFTFGVDATPAVRTDADDPGELDFTGPETDAELRYRLLKPRQRLTLWAYGMLSGDPIRWLESPRPDFKVDATNGPFPLSLDVVAAAGEPHSAAVHYTISTCLPPCAVGSDRLILSHRWQMEHGHDPDGYLTRTTIGEVVFHAGVNELAYQNPDLFRNQFLHPIPLGFERQFPKISLSSDGLVLRYVLIDTDPTIVFSAGDSGATQIEITEQFTSTSPDPSKAVVGGIGTAIAKLIGRGK